MTKQKWIYTFMIALFSTFAVAQGGAKIGIVDADRVIQNSIKGKRLITEFEEFRKQQDAKIQTVVQNYQDQKNDFQAKVESLSEAKRKEMLVELQNMETEIKRLEEDLKKEERRKFVDIQETIQTDLLKIVRDLAEQESYDIIFNHGPGSNLVYFSDQVDITNAVVKRYDETVQD